MPTPGPWQDSPARQTVSETPIYYSTLGYTNNLADAGGSAPSAPPGSWGDLIEPPPPWDGYTVDNLTDRHMRIFAGETDDADGLVDRSWLITQLDIDLNITAMLAPHVLWAPPLPWPPGAVGWQPETSGGESIPALAWDLQMSGVLHFTDTITEADFSFYYGDTVTPANQEMIVQAAQPAHITIDMPVSTSMRPRPVVTTSTQLSDAGWVSDVLASTTVPGADETDLSFGPVPVTDYALTLDPASEPYWLRLVVNFDAMRSGDEPPYTLVPVGTDILTGGTRREIDVDLTDVSFSFQPPRYRFIYDTGPVEVWGWLEMSA